MRSMIILMFLVSCVLGACAPNQTETKAAHDACAKVNDENWNDANWSGVKSSKGLCEQQFHKFDQQFSNGNKMWPCVYGGLPYFCVMRDDGSITVQHVINGIHVMTISNENMFRVAPHLVILK